MTNGFVDIAATASEPIVKEWVAAGGKVLTTSRSVPIKDVIEANTLGKEAIEIVKSYFLELNSNADGPVKLERIGLNHGFVTYDQPAFVALGN